MIEVTKINGVRVLVNPDLIEDPGYGVDTYHRKKNNCKRK